MIAWLWLTVPAAPLLGISLLWRRVALPTGIWLGAVPALALALWPAPPLHMDWLWPGNHWEAAGEMDRGWLAFTALVWACAARFGVADLATDPHRRRFWLHWSLAFSGNLLLVIAQDALSFYVGFSAMSLAAYGLIVHEGGPGPRRAGRIYLQLAICGEMLLLAAFLMRSDASGSTAFVIWQGASLDGLTLCLLLLGLGIKLGFWPLHFWLPLAHPAAPPAASAVLSGAMIEAAILGLWRSLPAEDPLLQQWSAEFLGLGLISVFYGVLVGLASSRPKTALAYSSISQMGYFLIMMALYWRHPGISTELALLLVLFAAHHGLAIADQFLGSAIHPSRPAFWCLLVIPALAIAGLPLTTGGTVKAELQHLVEASDFQAWSKLLSVASAGTALLLVRALFLMAEADHGPGKPPARGKLLPWLALCLAPLLLPWCWPSFRELLLEHLEWSTVWKESWPILAALALAVIAWRAGAKVPARLRHWRTPALHLSIRLKRWLQHPPLPHLRARPNWRDWRQRERGWNRFWNRRDPIASSVWLLGIVLLVFLLW